MGKNVIEEIDQAPFVAVTAPVKEGFAAEFGGADKIERIDAARVQLRHDLR